MSIFLCIAKLWFRAHRIGRSSVAKLLLQGEKADGILDPFLGLEFFGENRKKF